MYKIAQYLIKEYRIHVKFELPAQFSAVHDIYFTI